jgi:hypothetical protein
MLQWGHHNHIPALCRAVRIEAGKSGRMHEHAWTEASAPPPAVLSLHFLTPLTQACSSRRFTSLRCLAPDLSPVMREMPTRSPSMALRVDEGGGSILGSMSR